MTTKTSLVTALNRRLTYANTYIGLVGLLGWGALLGLWLRNRVPLDLTGIVLFVLLSMAIKRLGFQVSEDVTHSLVGVVDLAALFSLGALGGSLVAMTSGAICQLFYQRQRSHSPLTRALLLAFFTGGLNSVMVQASAWVYRAFQGQTPLLDVTWRAFPAVLAACAVWFVVDHGGWALSERLSQGPGRGLLFLREILPYSLPVELIPLPSSVLISFAYLSGNSPLWALMVLAILSVGLVLRNLMVSVHEERRHVHELSTLNALGQALLSARLDLGEICALIYQHTHAIVESPFFAVQLVGRSHQELSVPLMAVNGHIAVFPEQGVRDGAFSHLLATRRPVLVEDFQTQQVPFAPLTAGESLPVGPPPRSGLYVPLVIEEQVLGALSLQSPHPQAFTLRDQEALVLLAAQAALGLHTLQLYQQERQRAAQLAAVAEIGRKVAAILDLKTLFADTVKLVAEKFGYYHVSLFTVDTARRQVTFQASSSPIIQQRGVIVPWRQGLIGHVACTGESLHVDDVSTETRFLPDAALEKTRAELALPLRVERRILGVLDLQSEVVGGIDAQDVVMMQALADQIAIAIEDSHLYQAQQEQAWVSTALLQVAEAVVQLNTPEEVLETIVRLTLMLAGVERCMVLLWSATEQMFTVVESAGFAQEQHEALAGQRFPAESVPLLDQSCRAGKICQGDAAQLQTVLPPLAAHLSGGMYIALPLRIKGEIIGVMITTGHTNDGRQTEYRQTILSGIAHYAALALENARLYIAQREEAWVSTALLQVANMISTNTELDEALATVARLTPLLTGVSWCAVLLWDERRQAFLGTPNPGVPPVLADTLFEGQYRSPEDANWLQRIHTAHEPFVIPLDPDPGEPRSALRPGTLARNIDTLVAFPLHAHDQLLGVLLTGSQADEPPLDGRRMNILTGIANQTALAIETAQLHQQTIQQQRLEREIELARGIQESFLPECCPEIPGWQLSSRWLAARGVGGDFFDFIRLDAQHLGLVIADVSDKGVAAALYMALSRTVLRTAAIGSYDPADTLRRANRILLDDARAGMFVSMFYAILDIASGELTYARAGHNPPLLIRNKRHEVTTLMSPGAVLGILDDPGIVAEQIQLEPGDALLAYTDGIVEAVNEQDEEFGEVRLRQLVKVAPERSAEALIELVDAAVRVFTGDVPQFDDLTLIALKRA